MKRRIPHGRPVAGTHEEGVGVPHPPLDRLLQRRLVRGAVEVPPGDVGEGGRPGSAVEVLVGAADGEVHAPAVELDRHRSRRVAEVPEDEGPGVVDDRGDRLDVGEVSRAVGDLAEHHDRGPLPHGCADLFDGDARLALDLDPADGQATLGGDALHDVAVGGEVVGVDDDLVPAGPGVDRGPDQLVEQHGRRVADGRLARGRTEAHPGDLVAQGERQVVPALVPAADESSAPLGLDELAQAGSGGGDRTAEGVAVEVHEGCVGADELGPEAGQRIGVVEGCGVLRRGVGGGQVAHGATFSDPRAGRVLVPSALPRRGLTPWGLAALTVPGGGHTFEDGPAPA